MSILANLYESVACLEAYSKDGAYTNPVWDNPPYDFDGAVGQSRDVNIFLRNDGTSVLKTQGVDTLQIEAIDTESEGREEWFKFSSSESGLSYAVAGDPLTLSDMNPNDVDSIWARVTVPAGTDVGLYQEFSFRVSGYATPDATTFSEDFDVEIYVWYGVEGPIVEICVGGTIYDLTADVENVGAIHQTLEKEYGVSRLGNVTIKLKNEEARYTDQDADSIFYNTTYIGSWVRIKCGWGHGLTEDVGIRFQGRLHGIELNDDHTALMTCYDPLMDLMEAEITDAITFDESLTDSTNLASLQPIEICRYLIEDHLGLTWYDFDTQTEGDLVDADSFEEAYNALATYDLDATMWEAGSKVIDMIQDLLKITGAYMFPGSNGKIKFYVPSPARYWSDSNTYIADLDDADRRVVTSSIERSMDSVKNKIVWKRETTAVLAPSVEPVKLSEHNDAVSQGLYRERILEIKTKWNIDADIADDTANRLLARFGRPMLIYRGDLSWLSTGDALLEELGNLIKITDALFGLDEKQFEILTISKNLMSEKLSVVAYDAYYMSGKWGVFCSEADEGDGYGVTADDFDLWIHRFAYAGYADTDDPHYASGDVGFDPDGNANGVIDADYGTQDAYGNGIEELFEAW